MFLIFGTLGTLFSVSFLAFWLEGQSTVVLEDLIYILVIKNRNNQVPKWCTKFSLETTLKLEIKEIDIANLHRSKHFNFEYNFININQI